MKVRRIVFVTVVVTVVAALAVWTRKGVEACGPDWSPDVFVNAQMPDDMAAFAAGHLGLLGAKFDSDEFAIAYRYLNGGTVSAEDQKRFAPPQQGAIGPVLTEDQFHAMLEKQHEDKAAGSPPGQWLAARAQFAGPLPEDEQRKDFPQGYFRDYVFDENYVNCPDAAFAMAVTTLHARAAAWGAQSAWLKDWIAGQDAVFANCAKNPSPPLWVPPQTTAPTPSPMSIPAAAPANAPLLLQEDRAYQSAAADFYYKKFAEAAQGFGAIAQDKKSPWSGWGTYLAARATVRQAFAMGKTTEPLSGDLASFDMPTMQKAQQMLEALLAEWNPPPSLSAVEHEMQFVLMRTDPQYRVDELCAALQGPGPEETFDSDVADLNFVLTKGIKVEKEPALLHWIDDWRGPSTDAFAHWQKTHRLPWLVVAIARTHATGTSIGEELADMRRLQMGATQEELLAIGARSKAEAEARQLLADAAEVKPGTPGYETVFYHRVRLLTEMKRTDEARTLLDAALPEAIRQKPNSYTNALLGERMAVARNFEEFLTYAPRTDLDGAMQAEKAPWSCEGNPLWMRELGHCPTVHQPPSFDEDAVTVFNRELPLAMLVEAAQAETIPPNLRGYLALAAWTRAVVLQDAGDAAKLAPLLPAAIRDAVGTDVGFKADVAILRNPGLRPYVESGTTRLQDHTELDPYRDNWWNSQWAGRFSSGAVAGSDAGSNAAPQKVEAEGFLTAAQAAKGQAEAERVLQLPDGAALIGQRVLDYAEAHAEDPMVPEALALTVRATHYGAQDWRDNAEATKSAAETTEVSKAAFTLLHGRYPQTEWAKKTKYYY